MPTPNFIIFYVADPIASSRFYETFVGRAPVESSPGFVMFVLDNGFKLGLWRRAAVEPRAEAPGSDAELVLALHSREAVDAMHAGWTKMGTPVLQQPTAMEFGYTFTAADPDGHRLRVYHIAENPA